MVKLCVPPVLFNFYRLCRHFKGLLCFNVAQALYHFYTDDDDDDDYDDDGDGDGDGDYIRVRL